VSVAVAFLTIFLELSTLGLGTGTTWMVSSRRWSVSSALATTMPIAAVSGIVLAGVAVAIQLLAPRAAFGGIPVADVLPMLAALPLALVGRYVSQVALGAHRYGVSVGIPAIQALSYMIFVSSFAAASGLRGALLGVLASYAVMFLVAIAQSRRLGEKFWTSQSAIPLKELREAFNFGLNSYFATIIALVTYRFDLFLLSAYHGAAVVGYYSIAVGLSNTVWLFPASLSTVLLPRIASLGAQEESEGARLATETRAYKHTSLMLLTAGAGVALLAPFIIEPIYGARFASSITPTLLLLPGAIALGFASIFYATLSGQRQPRYALKGALVVMPLAVLVYFLMIPPFGADGAAAGSSIAYITSAVLAGYFLQHASGLALLPRISPGRAELREYRSFFTRTAPVKLGHR